MADFVAGYDVSNWFCAGLRKDTPAEIVDKLNEQINSIVTETKMKMQLAELSATAITGSPDDFGRFLVQETKKWGEIVRSANIKLT
jgi:tripartite-type tricarboxylate transporter receptor subunit TctC